MDDNAIIYEIKKLEEKVHAASLPKELSERSLVTIQRLNFLVKGGNFSIEYDTTAKYIDWITALPWANSTKDILDLDHAKKTLDTTHYGLKQVKDRIFDYLSIMIMKHIRNVEDNKLSHAPIICLVGLVGTGKTTVAYSIGEAIGRRVERIPFGGLGGAAILRGQSRVFPDAEPGLIMKSLKHAQVNNPVILLDEIDRIVEGSRSDIMGVLIELLDPEQNKNFTDHFIDYPFDLSNVFFVATANNTKDISPAVLDRLEIIQMPSYTDSEKEAIGKIYMFPKILANSSLTEHDLVIDDGVWPTIIRPLGYDPGIRTLQRTIEGVVRKVVRYMLEGKIKQGEAFKITNKNIKEFIPD